MRIAFDIDDTLYKCRRVNPGGQYPDYDLIQILRWFYNNGDTVYVWSAGGIDYAKQIVEKLGLEEMVSIIPKVAFGDKSNPYNIDIAFDDCETGLAKVDIRVKRDTRERCPTCGIPFVPWIASFEGGPKKWDGHTYVPNCEHYPDGAKISIG